MIIIFFLLVRVLALVYKEEDWLNECSSGRLQSPINIDTNYYFVENKDYIKILSRDYENIVNKYFQIQNNLTISIYSNEKSSVRILKNNIEYLYNLNEIQLHTPSEHTINNLKTDMEVMLIHNKDTSFKPTQKDAKQDIIDTLIISFLYKATAKVNNSLISQFKFENTNTNITLNKHFIIEKGFYHYTGSLTYPPCKENVDWIIFEDSFYISPYQLEYIKNYTYSVFPTGNSRGVKPLRSRNLYFKPHSHLNEIYIKYYYICIILFIFL